MNTVVNMSSSASRSSFRGSTRALWPSRPMFRTQPHTVWGDFPASSRMPQARRR